MLILVAENGRTYDLDCQPSTRVEAIQHALASLTGISMGDQIIMCGGVKLEAARPLSSYSLPTAEENRRVILFNKSRLRADSQLAPLEEPEHVDVDVPEAPSMFAAGHPLDDSPSPLVRALPFYERQFKFHLSKGQACWRVGQIRLDICKRLLGEQQVQALAIDSARENVEVHYKYICQAQGEFMRNYTKQQAAHAEILGSFERDMERLAQVQLHPDIQSPGRRTLLDCVPEERLRRWAADCARMHEHFAAKVEELGSLFELLKRNVEELFMTGPDVDISQLEHRIEDSHRYVEEQASVLQSLSKDLHTVKKLVEDTVVQMSRADLSGSQVNPLDACGALDPMSELHTSSHLPHIDQCGGELQRLVEHCYECKNAMSRCVHMQLLAISGLQSKIRDMRNKQAAFKEVGARQGVAFGELRLASRVPAAYKACLAEVVRRKAFQELYAGQASLLAERMARTRDKELGQREAFIKHHERYLPNDLLSAMGLYAQPPPCEVSVPGGDDGLLVITVDDLQKLALDTPETPLLARHGSPADPSSPPVDDGGGSGSVSGGGGGVGGSTHDMETSGGGGGSASLSQQLQGSWVVGRSLEMENARLRAEVASYCALLCAVDPAGTASAALRGGGEGTEDVEGAASSMGASAVAEAMARSVSGSIAGLGAGPGAEGAPSEGGGSEGSAAAPLPEDLLRKTGDALRAKDEVAGMLRRDLAAATQRNSAYEARIQQLEEALAQQAQHAGTPPSPPALQGELAAALGTVTAGGGEEGGVESGETRAESSEGETSAGGESEATVVDPLVGAAIENGVADS